MPIRMKLIQDGANVGVGFKRPMVVCLRSRCPTLQAPTDCQHGVVRDVSEIFRPREDLVELCDQLSSGFAAATGPASAAITNNIALNAIGIFICDHRKDIAAPYLFSPIGLLRACEWA